MIPLLTLDQGSTPLLISVPHDGRCIPDDISARMTAAGRDIPDTDWHVAQLYEFAKDVGASVIVANYSRYVVDLNRPADDAALYEGQIATGICPTQSFAGDELYLDAQGLYDGEQHARIETYWRPYHDALRDVLSSLKSEHGYALLWDAHSIPGEVPRLFDGELPILNIGTFDGQSCAAELSGPVVEVAAASDYPSVHNGRFKGGYITRHYGQPADNIHAVQLEISQRSYMDEASREFDDAKAAKLRDTLGRMLQAYLDAAAGHYA